jgi:protein-disulfide isomerase
MKLKWESVLTATMVGCALITTGLVVHREFFAPSPVSTQSTVQKPVLIRDWKSHLGQGVMLGPSSAPVQLIEFADFECPFCGDFHKKLKLLRERYPMQVALTYIHFPLPGHRFALPAARAAECAAGQARFEAMYDQLFQGQNSFGLKPWNDYATAAGVPDLPAFDACIKRTDPVARIEEDRELGAKLDVRATPTLIVNGWMLGRPPTAEELEVMVKAVLAGKSPVTAVHGS